MLQLDLVRQQFPSLKNESIFFDNAGGSQTLGRVMDKIQEYYLTSDVQMGGTYQVSQLARERLTAGENSIATFMNAPSRRTVVAGSSSTLLTRLFSICIGKTLMPGDEVIITNADHEANVTPWLDLQDMGIVVKVWEFNKESLQLELDDLEKIMTDKTRLVCVCHVSNIFGTIHPIADYTEFVHERGVQIFVDGVAYAPHRLIDVQAWDVDYYVFSWYKVFAGHCAALYGNEELLLALPGINHQFIAEDDIPYKFQPGGANYELTYSLTGVTDYFNFIAQQHQQEGTERENIATAFDLFSTHEEQLTAHLLDYLHSKSNIQIIGENTADKTKRVSTVAFIDKNQHAAKIDAAVHPHRIGIKTGDFYAKGITKSLGLDEMGGVVRVSMAHYNSIEELNKLIRIFDTVL